MVRFFFALTVLFLVSNIAMATAKLAVLLSEQKCGGLVVTYKAYRYTVLPSLIPT